MGYNLRGGQMTKIEIGAIEKDLVEKTKIYEEITGISTEKLVEDLLNDFFEDIHITNDYINIDEIYYFNFSKLLEKREVIATKNKLSENLNETFIIKKIPNNLDKFDKTYNTFCYNGNQYQHAGIYSYNRFYCEKNFKDTSLFQYYILFNYNEKTEALVLKLIDLDDINLLVDLNNLSDVLNDLIEFNRIFAEELERIKKIPEEKKLILEQFKPHFEFDNPLLYIASSTVIESYENAKNMAMSFYKTDSEYYDALKGKYNSEDLVILREGRLVKEVNDTKIKEELDSKEIE